MAKKGDKIWDRINPNGRPRKFQSPKVLLETCIKYFEWVEAHPIKAQKSFAYEGAGFSHEEDRMRAMTISGLCLFLGCTPQCWTDMRRRENFSEICAMVEQVIYEQKFAGAAAGVLNHSIIARELGLADTVNNKVTNPDGSLRPTIDPTKLSDAALKEIMNARADASDE